MDGESIGRWEGNTLVVDTIYFPGHHHWMDQGGASIPAGEQLQIVERIRLHQLVGGSDDAVEAWRTWLERAAGRELAHA
mgnify:CR=1 FL=1